jgi:hypothetical protein
MFNITLKTITLSRMTHLRGNKFSAFNQEILNLGSSDLHYNAQDWSTAKITPENIEHKIKLKDLYFISALCHSFDPVSPNKGAFSD